MQNIEFWCLFEIHPHHAYLSTPSKYVNTSGVIQSDCNLKVNYILLFFIVFPNKNSIVLAHDFFMCIFNAELMQALSDSKNDLFM